MKLSHRLLEARVLRVRAFLLFFFPSPHFLFHFFFSTRKVETSTWNTTAAKFTASLMKLLSAARDDVAELIRGAALAHLSLRPWVYVNYYRELVVISLSRIQNIGYVDGRKGKGGGEGRGGGARKSF